MDKLSYLESEEYQQIITELDNDYFYYYED